MCEEVSIEQILQEQQALEASALKKFPYDPSKCTLYMDIAPRQLLFACLTCSPPHNAICYSCGLRCHADHEIVELYTKRAFRCDCGTSRFGSPRKCELRPTEDDDWSNNGLNYCHNFEGTFCTCRESVHDESYGQSAMFQCLMGTKCGEDWFHARCVVGITRDEEVKRQEDNARYENDEDEDEDESGDELESVFPELPVDFGGLICPRCIEDIPQIRKSEAMLSEVNGYVFLKPEFGEIITRSPTLARLLPEFPFLDGNEESYTPERDEDSGSLLEAGEKILRSMPHEAVVNGLERFNEMQSALVQYVKNIAESGRAVTREDIELFFKDVL